MFSLLTNLQTLELTRIGGADLEHVFLELSSVCPFKNKLTQLGLKFNNCSFATLAAVHTNFVNLTKLEFVGNVKRKRDVVIKPLFNVSYVDLSFTKR